MKVILFFIYPKKYACVVDIVWANHYPAQSDAVSRARTAAMTSETCPCAIQAPSIWRHTNKVVGIGNTVHVQRIKSVAFQ